MGFVLIWFCVLNVFGIKVVHGVSDVNVEFTIDSITLYSAKLNWEASSSDFTDIICTFSILPSYPVFVLDDRVAITWSNGSLFSSAGHLMLYSLRPALEYTATMTFNSSTGTQNYTLVFNAVPLGVVREHFEAIDGHRVSISWTRRDIYPHIFYKIWYKSTSSGVPAPYNQEVTVSLEHGVMNYTTDYLYPGANYNFSIKGVSGTSESSGVYFSMDLVPLDVTLGIVNQINSHAAVSISWTPSSRSTQTSYKIWYKSTSPGVPAPHNQEVTVVVEYPVQIYRTVTLYPGANYDFSIKAVSGTSESSGVYFSERIYPLPPPSMSFTSTTTNMTIQWEAPASIISSYKLMYAKQDRLIWKYTTRYINDGDTSKFISGIGPGSIYDINICGRSGSRESKPIYGKAATVPAPPADLERKSATNSSFEVGWSDPTEGYVSKYRIIMGDVDIIINRGRNLYTFTELTTPGTEYTVTLYSLLRGLYSKPINDTFRIKPNPPRNMTISAVTSASFTVTWDAPVGEVTGYDVQGINKSALDSTHTFTGRHHGSEYIITIMAKAGDLASDEASATVVTLPEKPSDIQIGITTTSDVTLSWAAPTGGVTGYKYTMNARANTGSTSSTVETVSLTQTRLYAGEIYDITIWSYLNTTIVGYEYQESAQTLNAIVTLVPLPPAELTVADKTTTTVRIIWAEPTNTIFKEYKYKIYKLGESSDWIETVEKGFREIVLTGRKPGTTYTVEMWTEVDDTSEGQVESDHTVINFTMVPLPLTDLIIEDKTTTTIKITWTEPTNTIFKEYKYKIHKLGESSDWIETVEKGLREIVLTGRKPGTTYTFEMWTEVDDTSEGQVESDHTGIIFTMVPLPPVELTVTGKTTTAAIITWIEPTNTIFKEYKYKIHQLKESSDSIETVEKGLREILLTSREPGTTYTVEMWTTSAGQVESVHTVISFTMVPHPPSNLHTTAKSRTTIDIAWNPPNSGTYDRYQLTVTETTTKNVIINRKNMTKGTESYQHAGLDASRTYTFSLVAVSDDEQSESIAVNVATNSPDTPDLAISEASPSSIGCVWAAMANQVATASQLQLLDVNGQVVRSENFGSNTFEYTFEDLTPGQFYTVVVTITVDNAETTVTKQIILRPLAVSNFIVIVINETKVELNWDVDARSHQDEFVIDNKESTYNDQYSSESTKTLVISGLTAGRQYTFTIYAKVTHPNTPPKISPDVSYTVTTIPIITANISEDVERTDTNKVVITYTKETGNGEFNNYIFSIVTEDGDKTVTKLRNDTDRVVWFSGLTPGYLYTITAYTRSYGQQSAQKSIQVLTVPRNPILTCYEVQSEEITIAIERPIGGITHYKLECVGSNCEQTRTAHPSTSRITYKPLTPFNSYMFTVSTFHEIDTHNKTSDSVRLFCETVESAPQEVGSFDLDVDGYDIIVTWTTPIVTNGLIRNYTLAYVGTKENAHTKEANFSMSALLSSYTFTDLTVGYKYVFTIRAVTVVAGAPKQIEHYFPILEPSFAAQYLHKPEAMRPVENTDPSTTELTVSMVNPFTDTNGVIIGYSVIVATSTTKLGDDSTLMNWSEAHKVLFKRPYIAIYKCTDMFEVNSYCEHRAAHLRRKRAVGDHVDIEIGTNKQCAANSAFYCNGELQADTAYFILLRAYTETGLYTDTPFSDAMITAKLAGTSQTSNTLTIILAAVLSFVVGCVVVGLIICCIFRSRRRADQNEKTDDKTNEKPTDKAIYDDIVIDNANGKDSVQEEAIDNVTYEEIPVEPTKEAKSQYMALDKPIFYEILEDDSSEYYNKSKESTEEPAQYQGLQNKN